MTDRSPDAGDGPPAQIPGGQIPGGQTLGGTTPSGTGPAKVGRPTVLRRLTNLYPDARYLEIGVFRGWTFDRVPAARKVAVDPDFQFDHVAAQAANPGTEYHQVTSDEFFASVLDPDVRFDVVYLDGLHVAEQTLRDLQNTLLHLQPRGVVVIDDTHPPTALAAIADRSDFFAERERLGSTDLRWMGDVFKVVHVVASFMPGLRYATIANNHGQTVLWRRTAASPATAPRRTRSLAEIAALTFEDLVLDEDVLHLARFGEIRRALRHDLGV